MKKLYSDLQSLKNTFLPRIESQLDIWLTMIEGPQKGLIEAARYSCLGSGKRFRPLLTLAVASRSHEPDTAALVAACAIELIHTYSLIHDDLPCMDNDDLRRGKKALHKVVGEGLALLTGDFLLTFAFECLATCEQMPVHMKLELIARLTKAAGHRGMVGGQYADLTCHQHPQTAEFLKWMHLCKTGALMRASLEFGAIVSGCAQQEVAIWGDFGEKFGLLFQFVDDLIDSLPSSMPSSVPIGPSSYIAFNGVEDTLIEVQKLKNQLIEMATTLDQDRTIFQEMIQAVTDQYETLPQIANPS